MKNSINWDSLVIRRCVLAWFVKMGIDRLNEVLLWLSNDDPPFIHFLVLLRSRQWTKFQLFIRSIACPV